MKGKRIISRVRSFPHSLKQLKYKSIEERGNTIDKTGRHFTHVTYYSVGNAGDTVLSQCVRRMFQTTFTAKWNLVGVNESVDQSIIGSINSTDALIIGGGGLFLPDTNPNSISGWQWAISKEQLGEISSPIIGYSIGYNYFPGQKNSSLFVDNLKAFCDKVKYLGLRNHGSVNAVKNILPIELHSKISYQPCTTTLIRKLYDIPEKKHGNNVAINMAFDRENIRFGSDKDLILGQIADFAQTLEKKGYQVYMVYHMRNDKKIIPYMKSKNVRFRQCDLSFAFPEKVFNFYNEMDVVIGMRGHAQMIPFGLNCEIISLGTHDKMRWFLEDIDSTDWYVNLREDPKTLSDKLLEVFTKVHENDAIGTRERLIDQQNRLWNISIKNLEEIKRIIEAN